MYDSKTGLTDSILTPGVQQWAYAYDTVGNLTSRSDVSRNYTETFTYDNLYRLIQATKTGNFNNPLSQTITYDNAGNITSKSDVGTYAYVDGTNKLDKISSAKRSLIDLTQIFYSSFGKVTFIKYKEKLSNKGYSLILGYGPLKERVYSNNSKNNTTKYFRYRSLILFSITYSTQIKKFHRGLYLIFQKTSNFYHSCCNFSPPSL